MSHLEYDAVSVPQRVLARAAVTLFDDLELHSHQLPAAASQTEHRFAADLNELLPDAWAEVAETRQQVIDDILRLETSSLVVHGLVGYELRVKIELWLRSREALTELLEPEDEEDELDDTEGSPLWEPPLWEPSLGERLPRGPLPRRKGRLRRVLRRIASALGHADNWLDSLVAALGQHERLKEIKETIERGCEDVSDELGEREV